MGSRLALYIGLCLAAGSGVATVAAADSARLDRELRALEAAGWTTVVASVKAATPGDDVSIDADSCAALQEIDGVVMSGGSQYLPTQQVSQLGIGSVTVALVDWRLTDATGAALAYLSPTLAEPAGHPRAIRVVLPDGSTPVIATGEMPEELLPLGFESTVVITTGLAGQDVPGCLIHLEPWAVGSLDAVLRSSLTVSDGVPQVAALHDEFVHPLDRYTNRPSRWLPVVAGTSLGLVGLILARSRSSEMAAYRLAGTRRWEAFLLGQLEQLVASGAFFSSGFAALLVFRLGDGRAMASWPYVALGGMALYWVSGAVSLSSLRRSVSDMAKDR